jgi:hypothetical protein
MTAIVIPFKRDTSRRNPHPAIHDPRRFIIQDHYHSLLGMNQRQEGLAHKLSFEGGMRDEFTDAFVRFVEVQSEFKEVLEAYREQLLRALATRCPAAAKRIREGQSPRRRKRIEQRQRPSAPRQQKTKPAKGRKR